MLQYKGYYVTFTENVGINIGGWYCEVYDDPWMIYAIDDFVIPKGENLEERAKAYLDANIQHYKKN